MTALTGSAQPLEAVVADDEAQIRDLLDRMVAGYTTKDAAQIVADIAPDAVNYSLAPPLRFGRGDLQDIGGGRKVDMTTADGVQTWLDGFGEGPFEFEIRDLQVVAGGDAAYAHGLARMGSAGNFSLWFRITFGLRRIDGRWRIAHQHESVPFYMDQSMRAAVDLEP
ncbi:MAG TPA: nuclear transport factor 2 family protein [Streptosporangiaceae bacterium]